MKQDRGGVAAGILATIGVILVIGLVVVGGYLGGWWLQEDAVNRTAEINQGSYGRQVALVDDITRKYAEVQNPNLPESQKQAIVTEMCVNFGFLTGKVQINPNIANYLNTECN